MVGQGWRFAGSTSCRELIIGWLYECEGMWDEKKLTASNQQRHRCQHRQEHYPPSCTGSAFLYSWKARIGLLSERR
jgi:hypothetical protein